MPRINQIGRKNWNKSMYLRTQMIKLKARNKKKRDDL